MPCRLWRNMFRASAAWDRPDTVLNYNPQPTAFHSSKQARTQRLEPKSGYRTQEQREEHIRAHQRAYIWQRCAHTTSFHVPSSEITCGESVKPHAQLNLQQRALKLYHRNGRTLPPAAERSPNRAVHAQASPSTCMRRMHGRFGGWRQLGALEHTLGCKSRGFLRQGGQLNSGLYSSR